MSLADALAAGVAVAKSVLEAGELLETVGHKAHDGTFTNAAIPNLSASVPRQAVVSEDVKIFVSDNGTDEQSKYRVLFLEAVTVSTSDLMTPADGIERPVVGIKSPHRSDGGRIVTEVWLG